MNMNLEQILIPCCQSWKMVEVREREDLVEDYKGTFVTYMRVCKMDKTICPPTSVY